MPQKLQMTVGDVYTPDCAVDPGDVARSPPRRWEGGSNRRNRVL